MHAAATAVFISTRVAGVMILPLTLFLFLIKAIEAPVAWKRILAILAGYLALSAGLTVLFWPILWQSPWKEFAYAFSMMSKYPYSRPVLYRGNFFLPENLPWHYLPVWIGISTPLIVLAGILPCMIGWAGKISFLIKSKEKSQFLRKNAQRYRSGWRFWHGW